MKTVGAFSAKTHLAQLLEQVSRGETFLITKRGRPMASLSPVNLPKQQGPREQIDAFRHKFAASLSHFSPEEMARLRDLGRR